MATDDASGDTPSDTPRTKLPPLRAKSRVEPSTGKRRVVQTPPGSRETPSDADVKEPALPQDVAKGNEEIQASVPEVTPPEVKKVFVGSFDANGKKIVEDLPGLGERAQAIEPKNPALETTGTEGIPQPENKEPFESVKASLPPQRPRRRMNHKQKQLLYALPLVLLITCVGYWFAKRPEIPVVTKETKKSEAVAAVTAPPVTPAPVAVNPPASKDEASVSSGSGKTSVPPDKNNGESKEKNTDAGIVCSSTCGCDEEEEDDDD